MQWGAGSKGGTLGNVPLHGLAAKKDRGLTANVLALTLCLSAARPISLPGRGLEVYI